MSVLRLLLSVAFFLLALRFAAVSPTPLDAAEQTPVCYLATCTIEGVPGHCCLQDRGNVGYCFPCGTFEPL